MEALIVVGGAQADLVPLPLGPNGNFCKRIATLAGTFLQFRVQNIGGGAAGASTTRVDFSGHPPVAMIPTAALGPGLLVDLLAPIPLGAFDPDAEFRIEVDTGLVVPESNAPIRHVPTRTRRRCRLGCTVPE